MTNVLKNATTYFYKEYPDAPTVHMEAYITNQVTNNILLKYWGILVLDSDTGSKHRVIAVENLGSNSNFYFAIPYQVNSLFLKIEEEIRKIAQEIEIKNTLKHNAHGIYASQMTFSPRIYLYTNKLCCSTTEILDKFKKYNLCVEIIDESQLYKTVFISYGGPDEKKAAKINDALTSAGVKTWFFPRDKKPGQKLHRMMSDGVNDHDCVLLICSKNSLTRNGVLNEIERILDRELQEVGTDILIPITLDNYVFNRWQPDRKDIARQIKARTIHKIDPSRSSFNADIDKILNALKRE